MIRINGITITPAEPEAALFSGAAKALEISPDKITRLNIVKRSVDARKKPDVRLTYTVDVSVKGDEKKIISRSKSASLSPVKTKYFPPCVKDGIFPKERPVIIGFGPAGIFAALVLAKAGLRPVVLERGGDVDERTRKVSEFWETGRLDPACNVQFGEGGAGTFSDGKLTCGIKDDRIPYIFEKFTEAGANRSILIDSKPHIGTDVLRTVVKNLRQEIISLGGEVRFDTRVTKINSENGAISSIETENGEVIRADRVILSIGHSARDTFNMLYEKGVPMEPKGFSMGVRIEHLQRDIDVSQYAETSKRLGLSPADYKLSARFDEGDSAYTFCMCPGGYVVAAASENGAITTNGMSEFLRDGENANSALLVTLTPEDFPYEGPLGGVRWQQEIERRAFLAGGGNYNAPAQLAGDFLSGKKSSGSGKISPTYRPGVTWCDLNEVLPEKITSTLKKAIPALGRKLSGFDDPEAVLTAPEARSSSPVRILRGKNYMSEIFGLFPAGEGAGYAGGIVSAAVDGMRCAEALIDSLNAEVSFK